MVYDVSVRLPHDFFMGQLNFTDDPILGEMVELTPRAKFKIIELDTEKRSITLRFQVIFHDSDIKNILLKDFGFKQPRLWGT